MNRILIVLFALCVLIAPLFAPYDPLTTNPPDQLQPPSQQHLLGTDLLGRDVLSRALYGGRHTLGIATLATLIALVPGIVVGVASGLSNPWVDKGLQIVVSAVLAFPGLIVALVVLTLMGSGAGSLAIATGVMQIAPCIRIVRTAVLEVRTQTYMEAAASLGASRLRLILYHILPNIRSTLAAYSVIVFSFSVLNNAALSFLGLGADLSTPDWGTMLSEGRTAFRVAPWIGLAPGLGITATVLLFTWMARRLNSRE